MHLTSFEFFLNDVLENPVTLAITLVAAVPLLLGLFFALFSPRLSRLIIKNLGRNRVRTLLTCLATMILVLMVTLIWTVVFYLDAATRDKAQNLKVIVTERWQLPSQLPMPYANYLDPASPNCIYDPKEFGMQPQDFMTWSFYGGTLDPQNRTIENLVFMFALDPDQIIPMMDDMSDCDPALVQKLKDNRRACVLGQEKLRTINKRVGERFKLSSINYKEIDLEFEIVGALPEGRYDNSGLMNIAYLNSALDEYASKHSGKPHPLSDKRLNLIWLRVPDKDKFQGLATLIENASVFTTPQVKCETASSGVAAFIDAYRDLLWGVKWLLVPAILVSMAMVVANAIGISVRERMKEIAVMKVLGYRPGQILFLILGESLLVGGLSGLLAAAATFAIVNFGIGGIPFAIGFFPKFFVPFHAFVWGLAMGFGTAFFGSFMPALSARSVKVSEVFSRVT